jgi:3-hydroxymyristoyl/3-hydroxydecanoyl-(acyl carrier protein) dehydratase
MKVTNPLSVIYGDEAIYVQSFELTELDGGVGHIRVDLAIWKRDEEPSFTGKIQKKEASELTSALRVTKDHTRGHFRKDIAYIFPGHKSVRTAGITLGRFLNKDKSVDASKMYLQSYDSVKFRNPVRPGEILKTEVSVTDVKATHVTGDAKQSVDGNETMIIKGMTVKPIKNAKDESALSLDQLIEASAQTVGLFVLDKLQEKEVLPLFHGTGKAELLQSVHDGDNLLIKTKKARLVQAKTMNIFSADIEIFRRIAAKEELVAEIKNVQGLLLPREEVLKKIK